MDELKTMARNKHRKKSIFQRITGLGDLENLSLSKLELQNETIKKDSSKPDSKKQRARIGGRRRAFQGASESDIESQSAKPKRKGWKFWTRSKRRIRSKSTVETSQATVKAKGFKDLWRSLNKNLKRVSSNKLPSDSSGSSGKGVTLTSLIRNFNIKNVDELKQKRDRVESAALEGKQLSRTQLIKRGILTNFRRLCFSVPAICMLAIGFHYWTRLTLKRVVNPTGYVNKFEQALAENNHKEAELIVKNQISSVPSAKDLDYFYYALALAAQNDFLKTRQILEFLTDGTKRSYGPAHLEMARAFATLPKQTDISQAEYERHLIKAIVDKSTEDVARLLLGRMYRQRGRFNDAVRMLEPVRTDEEACIELGMVRNAQGRASDVPAALAPFVSRWRNRWNDPKNLSDFELPALALILLGEEKTVLDALDSPKVTISPTKIESLRELALTLWIERLLRAGLDNYREILNITKLYYPKSSCSNLWIMPLTKLSEENSPVRTEALKFRVSMVQEYDCNPAFLHEFANQSRLLGQPQFAQQIYESILKKYPDEILSTNNLAMILLEVDPKQPEKALELIESVIKQYPDFLEIYETRGQIKMMLGKPKEAIADYLKSLPVFCMRPEFHKRLAQAYRAAKDDQNALIHEELSNELLLAQ